MFSMFQNLFKVYADAPVAWQMWFQDPATSVREGITDLNADIQFFLIVILFLVLWLIFRIVYRFHHTSMPVPERFNHHTSLELVWAIQPSVIVTLIALPSLSLIFTYDDLVRKPMLTVKVIGRQWYWQYALTESVDFSLRKQTEKQLLSDLSIHSCPYTHCPNTLFRGQHRFADFRVPQQWCGAPLQRSPKGKWERAFRQLRLCKFIILLCFTTLFSKSVQYAFF